MAKDPAPLSRKAAPRVARTVRPPDRAKDPAPLSRKAAREPRIVERVQTGVRMEKRLLKVLRALADYYDISLGDVLEGIVLHAFDGKCPFGEESLHRIQDLKRVYGLDLTAEDSHRLEEKES